MIGRLEVFDPALCGASVLCGPTTDPDLARVAGDRARLRRPGVACRPPRRRTPLVRPSAPSSLETSR